MYFNWDPPSRKQNRNVIGSEFPQSHQSERKNRRSRKTGERKTGERVLRFIGKKQTRKKQIIGWEKQNEANP